METANYREDWDRNGFILLREAVDPVVCRDMLGHIVDFVRSHTVDNPEVKASSLPDGSTVLVADGSIIIPESKPNAAAVNPEDHISKVFNLHRREPFQGFVQCIEVLTALKILMGPDIDCFQSQFIFKNAGAWGQPWHQDSYYMPLDHQPQVGVWLAVSEATLDNGCLLVLPGSHREPIHDHVPDRRPLANYGYVEIVDQDFESAVPVLMQPGDLLIFHSFLMHRSVDNLSGKPRAAAMFHYATAGTRKTQDIPIYTFDFMPVARAG
ncbi:MAG: phytanoyl-CoA dioxygenase family protein [Oceanospirillaceae bacterium]|nr:phytanoyl-CoA dioxygenase family protein [Oceanospirillaceae bacterium]